MLTIHGALMFSLIAYIYLFNIFYRIATFCAYESEQPANNNEQKEEKNHNDNLN